MRVLSSVAACAKASSNKVFQTDTDVDRATHQMHVHGSMAFFAHLQPVAVAEAVFRGHGRIWFVGFRGISRRFLVLTHGLPVAQGKRYTSIISQSEQKGA